MSEQIPLFLSNEKHELAFNSTNALLEGKQYLQNETSIQQLLN
jgi:hypothetical protein